MVMRTAGGATLTLPCSVTKAQGKTKISAIYDSMGATIVSGEIRIGRRLFARAKFHKENKFYTMGPTTFEGEF